MSSQLYKNKLQQFQLENAEIKNATMEAENTSVRIAQHYRTLLELLRLLGIQEILEAGDTSTPGTVAKLLGGVSIADVFKVSSDIGLTDPQDPPQQVLTRLANGDIKLKPIEEFAAGSGLATDMNNLDGDLDDVETETILNKLGVTFSRLVNYFGDTWTSLNENFKAKFKDGIIEFSQLDNGVVKSSFDISYYGISAIDYKRVTNDKINFWSLHQFYGMGLNDSVVRQPMTGTIVVNEASANHSNTAVIRYNGPKAPVFQTIAGTTISPKIMLDQFVADEDCIIHLLPALISGGNSEYRVWIWCDAYEGGSGGSTTWGANEW